MAATTTGHSAEATAIATANGTAEDTAASGLALFRLALEEGDQGAWEAIVSRYRNLVLDWTRRSLRAPIPREHEEDWVTRAFERFWLAVGPEGSHFRDLPAALQYLKLCVRSVVLDATQGRILTRVLHAGTPLHRRGGSLQKPEES